MGNWGYWIAATIAAYLLGSIPAAVWISKRFYGVDVRTLGSGNAGSTNMYRSFGFRAGFVTQVIDIIKGVLAVFLPIWIGPPIADDAEHVLAQVACGAAAVLGHTFPVFAGFRGGKGVNTILGMMLALHTLGSLTGVFVFIVVLLRWRMVSLASICAVVSFPLYVVLAECTGAVRYHSLEATYLFMALGLLLACYILYSHRTNIARIRAGTERKVDLRRKRNCD